MTEEEAIEYLIQKDVPQPVRQSWDEGNLPEERGDLSEGATSRRHASGRNAWRISDGTGAAQRSRKCRQLTS